MPPASETDVKGEAPVLIGEWTFFPETNEILRNGERRRLEDRAARVLDVLRRRRGALVSKDDLIAAVWEGRSLSDHTVAVVISDLRKALDDDAKKPRYIETVSKRGYRLLAPAAGAPPSPAPSILAGVRRKGWLLTLASLAAAGAALAAAIAPARSPAEATIITVNNIKNETGESRYDPVASAANEFSADFIATADKSVLIRDFFNEPSWNAERYARRRFGSDARVFHLYGKVVLDGGAPFLALSLADGRDWSTVWTATLPVADGVADPLKAAIGDMLSEIEPRGDEVSAAAH